MKINKPVSDQKHKEATSGHGCILLYPKYSKYSTKYSRSRFSEYLSSVYIYIILKKFSVHVPKLRAYQKCPNLFWKQCCSFYYSFIKASTTFLSAS